MKKRRKYRDSSRKKNNQLIERQNQMNLERRKHSNKVKGMLDLEKKLLKIKDLSFLIYLNKEDKYNLRKERISQLKSLKQSGNNTYPSSKVKKKEKIKKEEFIYRD